MNIEKLPQGSTANINGIVVSESAKRQIAAKVLESQAQLSGSKRSPNFMEGFFDGPT
jgi:hypothetical protein